MVQAFLVAAQRYVDYRSKHSALNLQVHASLSKSIENYYQAGAVLQSKVLKLNTRWYGQNSRACASRCLACRRVGVQDETQAQRAACSSTVFRTSCAR